MGKKDIDKFIVHLNRSVRDMPAEDLKNTIGKLKSNSDKMRSIIINEKEYCNCKYYRSQRQFWYSTVKPTLDKLGLLSADDDKEDTLTRWDATLSKYLSELVSAGKMTYEDIMIQDGSRQYNVPSRYLFHPYSNIIVAVEKDTVYNIIEDIARLLACSCISCKGQCSLGSIEQIIRKIADCYKSNDGDPYEEIVLLTLTDYDPSGYSIAESLADNVRTMMDNLGLSKLKLVSKRIGLTPDQLTEDEVRNNMYSPKRKGAKEAAVFQKWMDATGGIYLDGKHLEKGLELDALDPEKIRDMFASELSPYIDSGVYVDEVKNSYLHSKIRRELEKYTDKIADEIAEKLKDKVSCEDFNMLELLREGMSYIPDYRYCSVEGVPEAVAKVFSNLDFTA